MSSGGWWNAPNLLTISRIVLAPVVIWAIVANRPGTALWILGIASLTDLLDGLLARRTGSETRFGKLLDPLADKILLSGVFLALVWARQVPVWYVAVVFGRDFLLLLTSGITMAVTKHRNLEPSLIGKGSTVLQILCAGAIMAATAAGNAEFEQLALLSLWPSAALTALSGIHYLARGLYYLWRR